MSRRGIGYIRLNGIGKRRPVPIDFEAGRRTDDGPALPCVVYPVPIRGPRKPCSTTLRNRGDSQHRGVRKMNRLVAPAVAMVLSFTASGHAAASTYYKTQSGKVRCFTSSYDQKVGGPAAVCETDAEETGYAFQQGPPCYDGPKLRGCNIVAANTPRPVVLGPRQHPRRPRHP